MYSKSITDFKNLILRARKSVRAFNDEKVMTALLYDLYNAIYSQIHGVLAVERSETSEHAIKEYIKDIFSFIMPIVESKIKKLESIYDRDKKKKLIGDKKKEFEETSECLFKYYELYDNYYALIAFRSLEHFALYLEWDKREKDKIWKYSIDGFGDNGYSSPMKGFFYYANQMVFDNKISYLQKQLPTAFGKTYSDSVLISYLLGYDVNLQILKVIGNKSLLPKATAQIVEIMTGKPSKRYMKVFPEFMKDYDPAKDFVNHIFSVCATKEGLLTLRLSSRDTNFECITKTSNRDGIACTWLFLDDIVQRQEIMNIEQHIEDLKAFDGTWKKRVRDEKEIRIVCGGTTYDPYDLLVTLKYRYSNGVEKPTTINKYTKMNMDETAVFVCVPKLDENDQLTFPHKTVLKSVLEDRKNDYELFMAMDMQQPLPPKDNPFYWDSLRLYKVIPTENRSDFCWASFDPTRKGYDNASMPIFTRVGNDNYLKDALYSNETPETVFKLVVQKVIQHKIVKLVVENNIENSIKMTLDNMLEEAGVTYCEVIDVYSVGKKEERIYNQSSLIRNSCIFPDRDVYSQYSEVGRFMLDIVGYNYDGKNKNDDSIDSVALYCEHLLNGKKVKYATVGTFRR